jgi:mycoredoxin
MSFSDLSCRVFYDAEHGLSAALAAGGGQWVAMDVGADPAAAEELRRLGLAVPDDLPAAVLASLDGRLKVLGVRLADAEVARLAEGRAWAPTETLLYATCWCPDCRRTKRLLDEAGLRFAEVDIEGDPGAEALVLARSGGRRVVPTLRLDGRLWAFNPEPVLLRRLIAP